MPLAASKAFRRSFLQILGGFTEMPADSPSITAMPPEQLADVLRRAGARHVTADTVQADIAAGAPTNDDGTMSLLAYAAWLVQRMADGD